MKGDKPMVPRTTKDIGDLAIVLGGMAVMLWLLGCSSASAAPCRVCRAPAVKVQRVVHHAAVQQVVATPVYYQVGAHVQQQAEFHTLPEYEELLELRGFRAGVEAATRQHAEPQSDAPPVEGTTQDAPAAPSPTPAVTEAFAARYPTLARTCARCHTGDDPKGGIWLDGTDPLDDDELAAIARAVVNGRMPKGHAPLEPQTEYDLLVELFLEERLPEPVEP